MRFGWHTTEPKTRHSVAGVGRNRHSLIAGRSSDCHDLFSAGLCIARFTSRPNGVHNIRKLMLRSAAQPYYVGHAADVSRLCDSTFEDLKDEREALQRFAFPPLATICESVGASFQAIDLRWGVRDEAAVNQKTMEICLSEIARCQRTGIKPNFLILLGDRYGWCPLPAHIDAAEFESVREFLTRTPVG